MVVVATTLQFVVNIVLPFSYNVHMFIVLPFLSGVFALSYFQGAFVIGMHEQLILVRITMSLSHRTCKILIFSRFGIGWTIEVSVFGYYNFGSICVRGILPGAPRILYPRLEMAAASF